MADLEDASRFSTHHVTNQPPPLDGFDPLACDPALADAVTREGAGDALPALEGLAKIAGSAQGREHARLANENPPVLRTHDRFGHRIDEIDFHPSWHWLLGTSVQAGLHAAPWVPGAAPGRPCCPSGRLLPDGPARGRAPLPRSR